MLRPLRIDEIGGARVRQRINIAGVTRFAGEEIPVEQLRTWNPANRNIMIEKGFIEVWPKQVSFVRSSRAPIDIASSVARDEARMSSAMLDYPDMPAPQRIIVPRGFGHYDVVEGRVLATNVTKDEAHAIAGTPRAAVPPAAPAKAGRKAATNKPRSQAEPPKMPDDVKPGDDQEENGPIE